MGPGRPWLCPNLCFHLWFVRSRRRLQLGSLPRTLLESRFDALLLSLLKGARGHEIELLVFYCVTTVLLLFTILYYLFYYFVLCFTICYLSYYILQLFTTFLEEVGESWRKLETTWGPHARDQLAARALAGE